MVGFLTGTDNHSTTQFCTKSHMYSLTLYLRCKKFPFANVHSMLVKANSPNYCSDAKIGQSSKKQHPCVFHCSFHVAPLAFCALLYVRRQAANLLLYQSHKRNFSGLVS
jgi:hypothetical protein